MRDDVQGFFDLRYGMNCFCIYGKTDCVTFISCSRELFEEKQKRKNEKKITSSVLYLPFVGK